MTAVPAVPAPKKGFHLHWKRILIGAIVIVVVAAAANLLGWDIWGWCKSVWDTMTSITVASLIAAIVLKTLQTGLTAFGWYWILRYGFPDVKIRWLDIFALYAASVALNSFLPANLGTLMYLIMLTATIAGASFAAILGGYAVQKIFYTLIGGFTYLYLFLSVGGSFDIKFSFVHTHPWATAILLIGGAFLIYLLLRRLWPRVLKWWDQAKGGGAILGHPRAYMVRVFLPSLGSWFAMLGVMCVFLHAYDIPITFHTLMRICGGNSIANVTSVTPGGAGVNQAFNVASLNGSHERGERDRLLGRPAARHHLLEHRTRDHPDGLGVRLVGWQEARRGLLHRCEAEGSRAVRGPQGEEGSEEGREERRRAARRRLALEVALPAQVPDE